MSTERDALMKNILAAPEDDELRLVFADWLEGQGDLDRANVIRLQCEAAKLPSWERRWQEASWEADAILQQHGGRFRRAELPAFEGVEWTTFERGFASGIQVKDAATLARHAAAIRAAAPIRVVEMPTGVARFVIPEGGTPSEPVTLDLPWLETLRLTWDRAYRAQPSYSLESFTEFPATLEVVDMPDGEELAWLLDWMSRHANSEGAALQSLKLAGNHTVGLPFVRELVEIGEGSAAAKRAMRSLARLDLGTTFVDYDSGYFQDPTVGRDGARILAEAKFLERLTSLGISHQRVGSEGLAALVAAFPRLHELHARSVECADVGMIGLDKGTMFDRLDLSGNAIKDEGARVLASAGRLARLKRLAVSTCELGPEGLRSLTGAPFWDTLRFLDLDKNPLGLAGMEVLAEAPRPSHLHTLMLADADLDGERVTTALRRIGWLRDLSTLDLSRNALRDLAVLLQALMGGSRRKLSLSRMGIDAAVAATLPPIAQGLYHLDLGHNPIGDAGLATILEVEEIALHTLTLKKCALTSAGLSRFVERASCPHLYELTLTGNRLDTDAVAGLLDSPWMDCLSVLRLSSCGLTTAAADVIASSPRVANLKTLDLRDNDLKEPGFLTLAQSTSLCAVRSLLLTANPWAYSKASQKLLDERFGQGWHWTNDSDDEDEVEDEVADDDDDDDSDED